MHQKIEVLANLQGKTAVILGLGKSGFAAIKYLIKKGAKIRISEIRPKDHFNHFVSELEPLNASIEMEFGHHGMDIYAGVDFVIVSPGVPFNDPILEQLKALGIPLIGEIDLALQEIQVPVVAITGTYGKTSTAFMAQKILETGGKKVFLASDLGRALSDYLLADEPADLIILELSSAQLEYVNSLNPFTNLFTVFNSDPNGRHSDQNSYFQYMLNLMKNINTETPVIYNYRNPYLRKLLNDFQGNKYMFRRADPSRISQEFSDSFRGAYLANSREIVWTENNVKEVYDLRQSRIYGFYAKENLMCAIILAKLMHVEKNAIQNAIYNFPGVPHRLELVKRRGGVRFFNDSRCLTVDNLKKSLEAFSLDPIILIAGGKDTQQDFSLIADIVKKRVKLLVLVGETKEQLNRVLGDPTETYLVGTFEEAILMSFQKSRDGDVILFSPGCESYDMFINYEERGTYFTKYLEEI